MRGPIAAAARPSRSASRPPQAGSRRAAARRRPAGPVHQAGVDGVEQHDLLPRLDGREQRVRDPVQAVGHADALGAAVVTDSGEAANMGGRRRTQRPVPLERQIGVGRVVVDSVAGHLPGHGGRGDVGVEVLQPQEPGVVRGVGGIPDLVDADAGDVTQAGNSHQIAFQAPGSAGWAGQSGICRVVSCWRRNPACHGAQLPRGMGNRVAYRGSFVK